MTPHDRLTATIKNRLRRLQDWEVADVVKDIEEAGLLAGEWVSVKERLPELETDSCSIGINFYDSDGAVYQGFGQATGDEWEWFSYEHRCYIENVQGWQPLPQPPKTATTPEIPDETNKE